MSDLSTLQNMYFIYFKILFQQQCLRMLFQSLHKIVNQTWEHCMYTCITSVSRPVTKTDDLGCSLKPVQCHRH